MIQASHESIRKTIGWYIKNKVPFKYEIQNETLSIQSKVGSYTTRSSSYSIDEINFIKEVKRYVIKNDLAAPYRKRGHPKVVYFSYSNKIKPGQKITDVVNIDLNGAYWETAYKLNLISDFLYEKGLEVRKQVRLATIGSLAKKKRVYEFDGVKQKKVEIKRSEETEILWDVICNQVGNLLLNTSKACKNDFIFFWVDGIYVKKSALKTVEKMFKSAGYNYKINKIEYISITEKNIFVKVPESEKEKPFPYRSSKIAKEFKGYNSDI